MLPTLKKDHMSTYVYTFYFGMGTLRGALLIGTSTVLQSFTAFPIRLWATAAAAAAAAAAATALSVPVSYVAPSCLVVLPVYVYLYRWGFSTCLFPIR